MPVRSELNTNMPRIRFWNRCAYIRIVAATLFCWLIAGAAAHAQNYQRDINEQVWKPFIKSFDNLDADAFLSLHSKDLVRSGRESNQVLNWNDYLNQQRAGDKRYKDEGTRRTIQLRFTERLANASQAIDVGIYQTSNIGKDGVSRSFYGRFHVVLRLENGTWKILVDTDSSEGGTMSEKDFLAAKPME